MSYVQVAGDGSRQEDVSAPAALGRGMRWGFGFGVPLPKRSYVRGLRVQGLGLRVSALGFRV